MQIYGERTMDNQICQKWFAKFCAVTDQRKLIVIKLRHYLRLTNISKRDDQYNQITY